jgi:mono/diheme cytochrome c family protein
VTNLSLTIRRLAGFGCLAATALAVSACGGSSDGSDSSSSSSSSVTTTEAGTTATTSGGTASLAAGKKVFTTNCGSCHTLADAGTSGNVGPNLDDLKPDTATVQDQVENGGGGMPAFAGQLTASEIAAVAKYVSSVAGKGGDAGGTEPPAGGMP